MKKHAVASGLILAGMGGLFAASGAHAAVVSSISDSFTGSSVNTAAWNETDKGLESGDDTVINPSSYSNAWGYNQPSESASGLVLGGTTNKSYWGGDSIESVNQLSTTSPETITVTRGSLTGSGSAYRSSLWIYQDSTHYLHFAQDVNESNWQYNYSDNGGGSPTGTGVALAPVNTGATNSTGSHVMQLVYFPGTGGAGPSIYMYVDSVFAGEQTFSNAWNSSGFTIILSGQGRAANDTVAATFTNLSTSPTPEPAAIGIFALAGVGLLRRRTRRG